MPSEQRDVGIFGRDYLFSETHMTPHEILSSLQQSELFDLDFPKRARFTHAEWHSLATTDKQAAQIIGIAAIERCPNLSELTDLVHKLGKLRYEPAVPTLATLWRDCAVVPLRVTVGHTLRRIGSSQARAALEQMIEDSDRLSVFLAIRAIFDADPLRAFDRLQPYFLAERLNENGSEKIPAEVISTFLPSSFSALGPQWTEPLAPGWLVGDQRWLKLLVELRRHEKLGDYARNALRYVDPNVFESMLANVRPLERDRTPGIRSTALGDLLSRYQKGHHEEVWQILRSVGPLGGELREEAMAVSKETMRRVAYNLDLLASRLAAKGWKSLSGNLRTPPSGGGDVRVMTQIEKITEAPLPPSIRAFWEVVGDVDLVWDYNLTEDAPELLPGIDLPSLDPICVGSAETTEYQLNDWKVQIDETHPELLDPFKLDLSPDSFHKANYSGGAPYGVVLPFLGADPIFADEEHELPFVDYLRFCVRWAGFPMLELYEQDSNVRPFVAALTKGLEPF